MNDTYVECLVQGKPSGTARALKVVLIILIVLFLLSVLVIGTAGIFFVILAGIALYFVIPYSSVEYEYLYLDREISIDRVLGKSRRKRVAVYDVDRMEIIAPIKSYHLDDFRNRQVRTRDYSAAEETDENKLCAMYYEGGERILINPNESMLKAMKNIAPRKVFMD